MNPPIVSGSFFVCEELRSVYAVSTTLCGPNIS